eukprot:CAMPEP_0174369352 /NCGR_PEP_ID=MMETSP0811_2-20130205/92189_1 /TAXON_ID=73025 ORGANISM="Eutreptiella gymnastica-like, Strain CCMP1594" /NCGR_SAMPLE_ID=MMETSP0811_2 /ASSEMBLY_ACC=CAM_ASM_000667 /LENGTH=45 /DNA_ID= /DNA_START= /DNA_END= /DNA_ORIENTATION=
MCLGSGTICISQYVDKPWCTPPPPKPKPDTRKNHTAHLLSLAAFK